MIEVNGLIKEVGHHVVLGVDRLTIRTGEIVGVLGRNGSGKTTLLKAISGIGELADGTVTVDGKPVTRQYESLAFISEEGSAFPRMTGYRYAEFLAAFYPRFDWHYWEWMLTFFQVDGDQRIGSLSKGQRAKVELAAGLAKRTSHVVMDEPFLGMDKITRSSFLKDMAARLTGEETFLIATHFLEDFENLFDRVLLLDGGRIRVDASVDDLRQQGKSLDVLLLEVTLGKHDRSSL
ncbi:ABC transporter ATP-binding protein [Gorillibacterium sp. CAU 1737]|uniref:ABC transporter ATP-binding protein n=1 Tax=Gorillibacterium sp. CAU 1737 TaxID=3140362 RepID=UPI0032602FB9